MHMFRRMPSKNVYVSEADLPLFDRAATLAGGMSAAVTAGLRLYLAQHDERQKEDTMATIELTVDEGPVAVTKRFSGRRLLRWRQQDGGIRSLTARVFRTAKGQDAVHLRVEPNWDVLCSPEDDDPVWENPGTWHGDWWSSGKRELRVFAAVDDMEGELPDELIEAVRSVESRPLVEALVI